MWWATHGYSLPMEIFTKVLTEMTLSKKRDIDTIKRLPCHTLLWANP
jgi:hypothetical protein